MMDKGKKFLKIIQLKNRQRVLNRKFANEGLTDEVLREQLEINDLRNKYDIPDASNTVFDKYVQWLSNNDEVDLNHLGSSGEHEPGM